MRASKTYIAGVKPFQTTTTSTTRLGFTRVSCSLGPPAPRGSSGPIQHRETQCRVSAVATDAPPSRENAELLAKFQDLLSNSLTTPTTSSYLDTLPLPSAGRLKNLAAFQEPQEAKDVQHKHPSVESTVRSIPFRRASRSSRSSSSSTSNSITIPSTRRPRSDRSTSTSSERRTKKSHNGSSSIVKPVYHHKLASGGIESELDADLSYLMDLQNYLKNNRKAVKTRREFPDAISYFLYTIRGTPVLTSTQEQHLGRIIMRGRNVRAAATELARSSCSRPSFSAIATAAGMPSADVAARAVVLGDDARSIMADFNLRLVFNIARRFSFAHSGAIELSDLISEGVLGLYKGIDRWDASRKLKFSTYGHWWIRQAVSRFIANNIRDVRVPVCVHDLSMQIYRLSADLEGRNGRLGPPTHRELAEALGIPVDRVTTVLRYTRMSRFPQDTVLAIGDQKEVSGQDIWVEEDIDEPPPNPVLAAEKEEHVRSITNTLLSSLPTRERNILQLRYGLNPMSSSDFEQEELEALFSDASDEVPLDGQISAAELARMSPLALQSIGFTYKLSKERIRQVETDALRRLRSTWRHHMAQVLHSGKPLTEQTVMGILQGECRTKTDRAAAMRMLGMKVETDIVADKDGGQVATMQKQKKNKKTGGGAMKKGAAVASLTNADNSSNNNLSKPY